MPLSDELDGGGINIGTKQSSSAIQAEATGTDVGQVDAGLLLQGSCHMPQGIGDIFRFDVARAPYSIAHSKERSGGQSGGFPEVLDQPEEQLVGTEKFVRCWLVADAFTTGGFFWSVNVSEAGTPKLPEQNKMKKEDFMGRNHPEAAEACHS